MQRPFSNGHKRPFGCNGFVTAVTPERALVSVGEWPLHVANINLYGGFRSETATWIQKWLQNPLELLESSVYNSFSRRRRSMGVVIEIMCIKHPGGPTRMMVTDKCVPIRSMVPPPPVSACPYASLVWAGPAVYAGTCRGGRDFPGGRHLDASRESNKTNPPLGSIPGFRASLSSALAGTSKPGTPHKNLRALG